MNLASLSLIGLLVAILIGFFRKTNVGILAIGISLILGQIFNISTKDLIAGFSSSLFLTMTGVSFLFGLLSSNNTLELLSKKLISLTGKNKFGLPIIMFLIGALICAVGPGAIPSLAIMPIIAVPIAISSGFNPVLLAIIAQCGVMGSRMSPLTPEANVVIEIMKNQGLDISMRPIILAHMLTAILISITAYIFYKGYIIEDVADYNNSEIKFNKEQIISLFALLLMIFLVIVFKLNVGLVSFSIGVLLTTLNIGNEKKAISNIPWSVIMLVLGVGILMNIVSISGGVELLSKGISKVMTPRTAPAVMLSGASFMSFFSSGLGVVFPTLMPTASTIANAMGPSVYAKELIAMVSVGGTFTGISPISTTGALIMSAVTTEEHKDKIDSNKLFVELLGWSIFTIFLGTILALLGVYKIFI